MVVSYDEPHHPFTCPVEYLEKYADFYYELGEKAQDDLANKTGTSPLMGAGDAIASR